MGRQGREVARKRLVPGLDPTRARPPESPAVAFSCRSFGTNAAASRDSGRCPACPCCRCHGPICSSCVVGGAMASRPRGAASASRAREFEAALAVRAIWRLGAGDFVVASALFLAIAFATSPRITSSSCSRSCCCVVSSCCCVAIVRSCCCVALHSRPGWSAGRPRAAARASFRSRRLRTSCSRGMRVGVMGCTVQWPAKRTLEAAFCWRPCRRPRGGWAQPRVGTGWWGRHMARRRSRTTRDAPRILLTRRRGENRRAERWR